MELDEHLFRREAGRMIAALTHLFGVHNLALAEDVTQDALCRALTVWKFSGVPDNPGAWLLATAKHRAIDLLRRERTARTFAPELGRLLDSEWTLASTVNEHFEPRAIADEQLRVMFSCCHPRLREDAQIALVLNVLCGFSVAEIAGAFLCTESAVEKRLKRGKRVLAASKNLFRLDGEAELGARLAAVQRALYLLFNEGYHGASSEAAVRASLCHEAIHLATLLLERPSLATPATTALLALMHFHAARLPTRVDAEGELLPLEEQDRSRWDRALIAEGLRLLDASATGPELSEYHVEAAIAAVHASAPTTDETRWADIVSLYDTLMTIRPSPVVALSRAIAVGRHEGPERGLEALAAIVGRERLAAAPFHAAAVAELELKCGRPDVARAHFAAALAVARNPMERRLLERRLAACTEPA